MFRLNCEEQSKSNKSKRDIDDNQSESKSSSKSSYITTSDYTTLLSTDGYTLSEPSTSSTSNNSSQTPSVFPKMTEKQREQRLNQIIEKLNCSKSYIWEQVSENNCLIKRWQFWKRVDDKNLYKTSVLFLEDSPIIYCCLNWKRIDEKILLSLSPVIHLDAQFIFYSSNGLKSLDVNIVKEMLSEYSIDVYAELEKRKIFRLYPDHGSKTVEVKDIDIILKLIQTLWNLFIKDKLFVFIHNAILDDTQVLYLWESNNWRKLVFKNWKILSTQLDICCEKFNQDWSFINWSYNQKLFLGGARNFALKVLSCNQGLLSLSKFTAGDQSNEKSLWDQVWISDRKRRLVF